MGFEERNHLQEWIANEPSSLGEELFIIQKEFSGFSDTKGQKEIQKAGASRVRDMKRLNFCTELIQYNRIS